MKLWLLISGKLGHRCTVISRKNDLNNVCLPEKMIEISTLVLDDLVPGCSRVMLWFIVRSCSGFETVTRQVALNLF